MPDPWEKDTVATFFHKQKTGDRGAPGTRRETGAAGGDAGGVDPAYAAAFVDFCQMLMNSNEFVDTGIN